MAVSNLPKKISKFQILHHIFLSLIVSDFISSSIAARAASFMRAFRSASLLGPHKHLSSQCHLNHQTHHPASSSKSFKVVCSWH
ncbi:hypothetical protein FRX31_008664 [Thalictrum thalictroides]|uniref:Uncharacterized protein n=1 Tax=Thalictrum thalictroides TaxID=46969 RepID=A0A7J6X041_THATH|nr:hypothetical protein FRX31_008664 [Thalictrum thalictroides]